MTETSSPTMRPVYVVAAHKQPHQVVRLVRRLHQPEATFIVHYDKRSPNVEYQELREELSALGNVEFLERRAVFWGAPQLAAVFLQALEILVSDGRPFDHVAWMSGQDYPIASNAVIQETLQRHAGHQLFEYFTVPSERWTPDGGAARFERRHFHFRGRTVAYPPFSGRSWVPQRLRRDPRQIPLGYQAYGGSTWMLLDNQAARYVVDFLRTADGRELLRFFRSTLVPDEMMLHTILMNSELRTTVVNENQWFIDWPQSSPHPRIIEVAHLERLLASPCLFARKFDETVDAAVMDALDREHASHGASRPPEPQRPQHG